ncbi:MAG: GMC family oxidoreductase [Actinobacteria bacterium]|nr:GMC family oxidoreductase [Actinomycetota bacterium]
MLAVEHRRGRLLSPVSHPDIGDGIVERADVVVIGSGAGGAAAAKELAEAGLSVTVLEEGGYHTSEEFDGSPWDRFTRLCRDGGMTVALGKPIIPMPLGRAVGGTTLVNSGTCFRTPRSVLDRWSREFGIDELDAASMDPVFDRVEEVVSVKPAPWDLIGTNGLLVHRGARKLGLSGGPIPRNITDCHGCGQCAFGCPSDAKQAMHLSYLPRAERAGARLFTGVRADRVVASNGTRSVEATILDAADRPVGRARFEARAVVVAAGAILTPLLLRASGLGRRSGTLGRNLRIHPATTVTARMDHDVQSWRGTLQSYYIDSGWESHDVMLEATNPPPGIGLGSLPGFGLPFMEAAADYRHLALLGLLVSDTSAGRVRPGPGGSPLITYRMNQHDLRNVLWGLALAAQVLLAAGAREVWTGLPGAERVSSNQDLERVRDGRFRPEHLKLSAYHPMGTAQMGADPDRAVCDPWGRVHGAAGVWVLDAALFPTCLGVNPQISIMAFATRGARALAADLSAA